MAKCDVCGKGAHFGIQVSHSHRRTNHMWGANVRSVRYEMADGSKQRINICTSCLRTLNKNKSLQAEN